MMTLKPSRSAGVLSAILFIAQFILIWTTFFILSSAIGWPASLDDPAGVALPRLIAERSSVLVGYTCYLIAALLLVPAIAAFNARVGSAGHRASFMVVLAAMSAMAKAIGISRWLFAMPTLAVAYAAPGADRPGIAVLFQILNNYAGGIGETLGVGLISGTLTIMIGLIVFPLPGRITKLLGCYTVLAGLLLFANLPAGFGVEMGGTLTLSNIAWQFALLGVGIWSLTPARL